MTSFTVHSYLVVRATVRGIEAESKQEAIRKADEENVEVLKAHLRESGDCEFSDEVVGYRVDVDGEMLEAREMLEGGFVGTHNELTQLALRRLAEKIDAGE